MGQTVKISELKRFDVFAQGNDIFVHLDKNYVYLRKEGIDLLHYHSKDLNLEVKLLGRMEFVEKAP